MLQLRPTREDDLAFVLAAESHSDNCAWVFQWTPQQHCNALNDANWRHLIVQNAAGERMGYAILSGLTSEHCSICLDRIVITRPGQGLGRTTLIEIQKLAFGTWGAHRLWLDVKSHNTRAKSLYESCGFVVEGTLRECLQGEDGFDSLVVMSLLEDEIRR